MIELGKLNRSEGLQFRLPFDVEKIEIDTLKIPEIENPYFRAASVTLTDYLSEYPGKSAPALLLQGVMMMNMGNEQSALSYFDQAAIEYPRQAEELTDLLNSYRSRTYRKVIEHFAARYSKSNVIDNAKKNYLSDLSVDVSTLRKAIEAGIRINGSAFVGLHRP